MEFNVFHEKNKVSLYRLLTFGGFISQLKNVRAASIILLTIAAFASAQSNPKACADCHRDIADSYRRTGMARSFYQPSAANTIEDFTRTNTYYHKPSDSYFTMLQRDGKFIQRRYQLSTDGRQINVMEKQIDYVMGSGNHARTYLSRTSHNTLVELPLAWYTEKGGYWAMNPGYDRPAHAGFRRTITYDCMFCHNAYPRIPAASEQHLAEPIYEGALPEGIDCQRCHGPGSDHSKAPTRTNILNPARLTPERQMEVCMQCHLETTSFPLPNAIQRYERGPFSYNPAEALSRFILFFDHAPEAARENKFEIVSAPYRLRRSSCFLKSAGKLTCTTCHNPHDIPRGVEAQRHYTEICRECHSTSLGPNHPQSENCTDCHMPKRRTEDVVHVAVTDHYIQRTSPPNLLADLPERHDSDGDYRGKVVPYYSNPVPPLYLAIAQVIQRSNLTEGIAQLSAVLKQQPPQPAEYYFQLAEALRNNNEPDKALPLYKEAIRRNPKFVFALQRLASSLRRAGNYPEAEQYLKQAATVAPTNPITWYELGLNYQAQNKPNDAIAALQKAISLDPDMSEAHNNLGVLRASETDFQQAIRIQPDYADAHYNYAMALGSTRRFDEAQTQLEAALHFNPNLADAHELLADLLMSKAHSQQAIPHYNEALRLKPEFGKAHLGLGLALASTGNFQAALPHLKKAASDPDPNVRQDAAQALRQIPPQP
jgi:tetratricopeptide (TPR) repeat protein